MGWAVGWDSETRRFRGYGVPAWCDAYSKGCRALIDRGLGYVCETPHIDTENDDADDEQMDPLDHPIFVCGDHTCADVDLDQLPPEHPDWLRHVLADESWERWRAEEPERVEAYRVQLEAVA